ncbi:MAG: hypothetical protein K2M87_03785 [Muribaculaceae bacterium]|nr:hypothetical protein [Muribaculaceae bacterium]
MKTFTVIRNYDSPGLWEHSVMGAGAKRILTIPDSCILRSGNAYFVPDFSERFEVFPSIACRIGRLGKGFAARFAGRYIESMGICCCAIATPMLSSLRSLGDPWSEALCYDRSLWLGNLTDPVTFNSYGSIKISATDRHGNEVAHIDYDPNKITNPLPSIIEELARDNTLKNGDLILVALTPEGIILEPGIDIKASAGVLNDTNLIDIRIR